jgi:16S rRNA (guanine527-N7)-methyltransferase
VSRNQFRDRLVRRARRAGVQVSSELAESLETYYKLLASWNTKINLTGLNLSETTPESIDRLLIEPLAASRHVSVGASMMLDVGSGGGSPALPLALTIPGVRLVMVESKTRKSIFLREAVRALQMRNTEVVTARFEELLARPEFHETQDLVTLRAVRTEAAVFTTLQAFMRPGGQLFLFKGSGPLSHGSVTPLLSWKATHGLVEATNSRLVVFEKQ